MTRDKHQPQQIVADIVVKSCIEIRHDHLSGCELATEFIVFAFKQRVPAEMIDRAMLGGSHKPGPRIIRDARFRPLFERSDKGILREVLGNTDIAHNPREAGDQSRGFDPTNRVNRTVDRTIDRSMGIGSHCYRSNHGSIRERKPEALWS
jgi:hypothetical protein